MLSLNHLTFLIFLINQQYFIFSLIQLLVLTSIFFFFDLKLYDFSNSQPLNYNFISLVIYLKIIQPRQPFFIFLSYLFNSIQFFFKELNLSIELLISPFQVKLFIWLKLVFYQNQIQELLQSLLCEEETQITIYPFFIYQVLSFIQEE